MKRSGYVVRVRSHKWQADAILTLLAFTAFSVLKHFSSKQKKKNLTTLRWLRVALSSDDLKISIRCVNENAEQASPHSLGFHGKRQTQGNCDMKVKFQTYVGKYNLKL